MTGHDRDEVGLLIFPSLTGCRTIAGLPAASLEELVDNERVRSAISRALAVLTADMGSSARPKRALLLSRPPSTEAGEMTDKGYLNQRAVLRQRPDFVERLYQQPLHQDVIQPIT
ncbi:MAG: hypothetical protein AB7O44_20700 [Hyphomicrobiaceae bacterium]